MAVCRGTKRDGGACTLPATAGSPWCWNHDPARAEERRRNASHAAAIGNSKVGAEIKGVRLMVRDLVETTVSGGLHPTVKKRLTDVVGLLQVYSRLAELEMAAGEVPRFPGKGYVALPEDTADRAKEWAEKEGEKARVMEGIASFNRDPTATLEAMK